MRTTVNVTASLLESARTAAVGQRVTLSELLEDALRAYLSPAHEAAAAPFRLHTVAGRWMQPGLDLDRTSTLVVADDESAYGKSV